MKVIKQGPVLKNILFLDIETVSEHKNYEELTISMQELRSKKSEQIRKRSSECEHLTDTEIYAEKAGIYAEYGKIIVISVGMIRSNGEMNISSYAGDDEKKLLTDFSQMLEDYYSTPTSYLCGHNAREFDIPYLCRRMKIHGLLLPKIMPTHGQKPWDGKILDTMEMWKFGDRKAYTSLDLLCNILKIDSPKSDINGSDVSKVYREQGDLTRITEYCERDVKALIEVYRKLV